VKRWKGHIQAPAIQHLRGSLVAEEHGLFITTSDYSTGAYHEAVAPGKTPIHLLTGQQLLGLLIEQGLLVQSTAIRVLELAVESSDKAKGMSMHMG
jgi:restriction endonuclease Mrr